MFHSFSIPNLIHSVYVAITSVPCMVVGFSLLHNKMYLQKSSKKKDFNESIKCVSKMLNCSLHCTVIVFLFLYRYFTMDVESPPTSVMKLRQKLSLDTDIIRATVLKQN